MIKEDFKNIKNFHVNEESLLNDTYDKVEKNYKFIFDIIGIIKKNDEKFYLNLIF